MNLPQSKYRRKGIMSLIASVIVIIFVPLLLVRGDYAAVKSKYDSVYSTYQSATTTEDKSKLSAQLDMLKRQMNVADSYENLKDRIDALQKNDPRKDDAEDELKTAKKQHDTFLAIDPTKKDSTGELEYVTDDYKVASTFNDAEKDAISALNDVNKKLLAPSKPGNVPEGDILEDFAPGIIRILLRFASLAVLVAFVVSGLMFVMAFGVEERLTKAKHMLYYTLIGFAVVTLAFAIVKAVTDIDFFGFI